MSDPRTEWQVVHREDYPTPALTDFVRASHGGGRWVAVGRAAVGGGTTANRGLVATATAADGSWSSQTVSGATGFNDVAYGDGVWVAVGQDPIGVIFTATSPSGTWTQATMPTEASSALRLYAVAYDGTKWGAIGRDGRIYTATDPTGTWSVTSTVKADAAAAFAGGRSSAYIDYVNGTWVAAVTNTVTTSISTWAVRIYTADSPDGTWTFETYFSTGVDTDPQQVENIFYADGTWYVAKTLQLWSADTLGGTWSNIDLGLDPIEHIGYGAGDFVVSSTYIWVTSTPGSGLERPDLETEDATVGSVTFPRSTVYNGDEWLGVGFADRSGTTFGSGQGVIWTPGSGGDGWGIVL